MTRFEEATQSVTNMSIMVAFCIAAYLEGAKIHEFSDSELTEFMSTTSEDIEIWLKQTAE